MNTVKTVLITQRLGDMLDVVGVPLEIMREALLEGVERKIGPPPVELVSVQAV
jgi:hypothetical protein